MKAVLAVLAFTTVAYASVVPSYNNYRLEDLPSFQSADPSDSPHKDAPLATDTAVVVYTSTSDYSADPSLFNKDLAGLPPLPRNLHEGTILATDTRLHLEYVNRAGIPNIVQHQDIVYRSNNIPIRAVRAFEIMQSNQGATARITNGGIGFIFVVVRISSERGGPIYYQMDVWGR